MSVSEVILTELRSLVARAQKEEYSLDPNTPWVYSTFTKCRPNETKFEPGRKNHLNSFNKANQELVTQFCTKHSILTNESGNSEKFIVAVKTACITEWGQAAWDQAEANHRQKWRLAESIASWIEQTVNYGQEVVAFAENPAAFPEVQTEIKLLTECNSVLRKAGDVSRLPILVKSSRVQNIKAQDVNFSGKKLILINGSAGTFGAVDSDSTEPVVQDINGKYRLLSALEAGGGTFGDPCHSLTTQEESVYRSLSLAVKLYVQFYLSEYVEVDFPKERISQFMYKPEYAPSNGKALVVPTANAIYVISAANNQNKNRLSYIEQVALFIDVFDVLFQAVAEHKVNLVIGGAFGLGVFDCDAEALADGILAAQKLHSGESTQECDFICAYYIAAKDFVDGTKAKANFDKLKIRFGC